MPKQPHLQLAYHQKTSIICQNNHIYHWFTTAKHPLYAKTTTFTICLPPKNIHYMQKQPHLPMVYHQKHPLCAKTTTFTIGLPPKNTQYLSFVYHQKTSIICQNNHIYQWFTTKNIHYVPKQPHLPMVYHKKTLIMCQNIHIYHWFTTKKTKKMYKKCDFFLNSIIRFMYHKQRSNVVLTDTKLYVFYICYHPLQWHTHKLNTLR